MSRLGKKQSVGIPKTYRGLDTKRWTIQKCLVALGAPYNEVYFYDDEKRGKCPFCGRPLRRRVTYKPPTGVARFAKRTIYRRFSTEELEVWLDSLWKEAREKYHPDRHPKRIKFYTKKFQEISEAYQNGKRILRYT